MKYYYSFLMNEFNFYFSPLQLILVYNSVLNHLKYIQLFSLTALYSYDVMNGKSLSQMEMKVIFVQRGECLLVLDRNGQTDGRAGEMGPISRILCQNRSQNKLFLK